ncbi:MAG TPA: GNAT family protein [Chitinophagaceae bacterium]|nr:GNAT family protein [Chitinophagaceae bacterium]
MMNQENLSVRELELADMDMFMSYWFNANESSLADMGVDIRKLPTKDQFRTYWESQLEMSLERKLSYCVVWLKNDIPVGHSNTRPINFGKDAHMHLHLWNTGERRKGVGCKFVKLALPLYFEKLQLKDLYCEPYALNPAPNRLLEKVGFDFVKEHRTNPGPSNFEQQVNLWHLSREKFEQLYKTGA